MPVKLAPKHEVHKLHQYRQSIATKAYDSRGKGQVRCSMCLLATHNCTCDIRTQVTTNAAFMLIMHDIEVLKPSNTGRLIADLIPDTHAFLFSRTEPNADMISLIDSGKYRPVLVFPREYCGDEREVIDSHQLADLAVKDINRPLLFVLFDGSWREAKKMFRKSPYLNEFPVLSLNPEQMARYALRKGSHDFQLSTAEVAILVLEALGEKDNAISLGAWFDLFVEASKYGRNSMRSSALRPLSELRDAFELSTSKGK